jgi:hypothetical protein
LLLERIGLPALARDAVLIAAGTGLAIWAGAQYFGFFVKAASSGLIYGALTSILWVLALHLFAGPRPAVAATGAAPTTPDAVG